MTQTQESDESQKSRNTPESDEYNEKPDEFSSTAKLYTFNTNSWILSNHFDSFNVVILLDPQRNRIYYYEGKETSAHDHDQAKKSLIRFKNNYPEFSFVRIKSLSIHKQPNIPHEVLTYLKTHRT
ncbi:hypothetical protein [Candidatus Harpocratesius sp.]